MDKISELRSQIYEHFHGSNSCEAYFFDKSHDDEYAVYYTAMYLLQDSTDGISQHRKQDFSQNPLIAYIEIWGILQAIIIQQDSIVSIYRSLMQASPIISANSKWKEIRDFRNLCGGHPVDKGKGGKKERAFMGRGFGSYNDLNIEVWNQKKRKTEFKKINLGGLINDYALEAEKLLQDIINLLPSKWP